MVDNGKYGHLGGEDLICKRGIDTRLFLVYTLYTQCVYQKQEGCMVKTLTTHGNSMALIIEKPILDILNITRDTPLEVTTDGHNLIISPVASAERGAHFKAALAKVNKNHGKTLKKLSE
jgi:antitoxin MazE